jgi:hypothetical protein
MTSEIIKQFNEIVESFLIQVSPLIGSFYPNRFSQIIKYNSILPIEQFTIRALPLKEKIETRDESYFNTTDNYEKHFSEDENYLDDIIRFQHIYKQIDEESKSNLWDIIQAMMYLAEQYVKIKYKL